MTQPGAMQPAEPYTASFPAARISFIQRFGDLSEHDTVVACDPPIPTRSLRGMLGRLAGRSGPLPGFRAPTQADHPGLVGYMFADRHIDDRFSGLPVFNDIKKTPDKAVLLLRAAAWEQQLPHYLARGFTRFAVLPRRDLASGARTVIESRAHRLIFVPNYKVMYSSFRDFMRDTFAEFADAPDTTHALNRVVDLRARTAAKRFKFSMVRNPWDRLASAYREKMIRDTDHPNHANFFRPVAAVMKRDEVDFDTFTRYVEGIPDSHADPHWFSSYHNLHAQGTCLMDFTGRIEHVARDLEIIGERTDLSWNLPVLNRTRGPGTAYRELYASDRTIERVAQRYREDVETYGYTF